MSTPNIIDSLFLELGIDTSKFNKDQQNALAKIAEFEKRAKKSGKGAGDAIKTVGEAFRDLSRESRIGASAAGIDSLAQKLTMLGKSAQVAGVGGGIVAEGLGMLLSPVSLGIAAVGFLGAEMWDLNKQMTATNATIYRQAQLSGINADNMWDWGEAARLVGANPQEVTGGIAALQTSILGMGIGAANATPQLTALARLGVGFDFRKGANIDQLMAVVHQKAAASGYENLGALRALTSPVMNDAMFNIATSRTYDPSQIKAIEPKNLSDILQKSLESQAVLGKLGIAKDILAETAYGGTQGLMQAMVELLTKILEGIDKLVDFFTGVVSAVPEAVSRIPEAVANAASGAWGSVKGMVSPTNHRMTEAMQFFMSKGASKEEAAAIVGNLSWESKGMQSLISNKGHVGYAQWDETRQKNFKKRFGYAMGSGAFGEYKQGLDELEFVWEEYHSKDYEKALKGIAAAKDLMGKTGAFMDFYEKPGANDHSLGGRYAQTQAALRLADVAGMTSARPSVSVTNDTHIGEVNIHTPSDDPANHATVFIKGVSSQPLLNPTAQSTVSLATRGMVQ